MCAVAATASVFVTGRRLLILRLGDVHNSICEGARNVHHNSIKSEYYQCIGFRFRLDFPIWLSRGDRQHLRKIIMIILLHKIISIIHLPIVFMINLLQFHASVVASCLVATELRNLTQT